MNTRGMTLLEMMFAVSIFTVVMAAIFGLSFSFGDTVEVQEIKATTNDEARRALQFIIPDLRQAVRSTINWDELPGERISYCVPEDISGNGLPVNVQGRLEIGPPRVISRDLEDVNGDGLRETQLIVQSAGRVQVLANDVSPDSEQPDAMGVFGPAQDLNGNGRLDRGIWFEPDGRGIRVTIQTQGVNRQGHILRTTLQETVVPRNSP